jgi:hypothetical protein
VIADYATLVSELLHHHHHVEDEFIWPLLLERPQGRTGGHDRHQHTRHHRASGRRSWRITRVDLYPARAARPDRAGAAWPSRQAAGPASRQPWSLQTSFYPPCLAVLTLEGCKPAEIAAMLGIEANAVRMHLHHARAKVAASLAASAAAALNGWPASPVASRVAS